MFVLEALILISYFMTISLVQLLLHFFTHLISSIESPILDKTLMILLESAELLGTTRWTEEGVAFWIQDHVYVSNLIRQLRPQIRTALSAQLIADHVRTDLGLSWYVEAPPFNFSEHSLLLLNSLLKGLYLNLGFLIRTTTLSNYHPVPRYAG
jgi:hypothetical protein